MKFKPLLIIPLSLLMYASCTADNEQDLGFIANCTEDIQTVSFTADIQPIFNANCAISGCHTSGGTTPPANGYNFNNYNGIVAVDTFELKSAINRVQGFEPMPRNAPKLPACDIKRIEVWISQGQLNN